MRLITPDLDDFMNPVDVEGHVFSPNNFREETLSWIENRNLKAGCQLPCLKKTDLRIIPGSMTVWAGAVSYTHLTLPTILLV